MSDRLTDRARKALQLAHQEACRLNHEYIGTEHLLLGLVKEGSGVAAKVLRGLGVDLRGARRETERLVPAKPNQLVFGRLPRTPRAKSALEFAAAQARRFGQTYVGTDHLLLALLQDEENSACQVLVNLLGPPRGPGREEVLRRVLAESAAGTIDENSDWESTDSGGPQGQADRIAALERQLGVARLLLGAFVGTAAGALVAGQWGAVLGLFTGLALAALGWLLPAALAGSVAGALVGSTHLPDAGGAVFGALLGSVLAVGIMEIGRPARGGRSRPSNCR